MVNKKVIKICKLLQILTNAYLNPTLSPFSCGPQLYNRCFTCDLLRFIWAQQVCLYVPDEGLSTETLFSLHLIASEMDNAEVFILISIICEPFTESICCHIINYLPFHSSHLIQTHVLAWRALIPLVLLLKLNIAVWMTLQLSFMIIITAVKKVPK